MLKNYKDRKIKTQVIKKKIIFCTSYLAFPITHTLIKQAKESFIVVTDSKEIYNFLIKFYPKDKIILFSQPKSITNINPIFMIKNLYWNYLLKKKTEFFFTKYVDCNVYSFIKAFGPQIAYALKFLSKKNTIYWKPLVKDSFLYTKKLPTFKIFLLTIYLKLMYGHQYDVMAGEDKNIILRYSNNFYRSIGIKKMNTKVNYNLIKNFIKKKIDSNIKKKRILLLSSAEALELEIIDKSLYNDWVKRWITPSKLKRIVLKRKIYKEQKYSSENLLAEAPLIYPANLLIYQYNTVVGYHSATLFEAANIGCKVISVLNLLQKKNNKTINYHKKYITKNLHKNKKILFPKNWKQFNQMIDGNSLNNKY